MGKILDEPQYPVVEKTPGFWRTVKNFNTADLGMAAAAAGFSVPIAYMAGASKSPIFARVSGNLMGPSLYVGAVIGVTAGFLMAFQSSAGRLMGFFPNEAEVAASGAARR
ncbi:hypothetical protein H632_c2920p1 [Helicosporidium sp. ATCC 50920]|nr:hypothetical protein H632_c2920p1 [Helicosporidium sp. ATCC 50920]|eukprot:KDD72770.1 hypothetical protein H632_c2920p1 [Helicosporidium sp. ATCC 50920]